MKNQGGPRRPFHGVLASRGRLEAALLKLNSLFCTPTGRFWEKRPGWALPPRPRDSLFRGRWRGPRGVLWALKIELPAPKGTPEFHGAWVLLTLTFTLMDRFELLVPLESASISSFRRWFRRNFSRRWRRAECDKVLGADINFFFGQKSTFFDS